ncbi:MAG: zf-TFIIB domain-containing protein [Methanospirillum sp.]|uniref:TFIIB-type zinc ribbon-containing protein n=1 Tax=Methanospirillum sp. TaxID=45200 RepID=UPI00236901EB|nr:zf-TFIIB domain-containing protein [Methanospirillum sp.]MDD1730041.1 zf-TFIIB domain-containing protein [Methanospirillum sp.]
MKCPVCNVDLLMGERLSVSIDYCPQCRGIWLEKGKLDQLLNGGGIGQSMQGSSGSGGVIGSVPGRFSDSGHDHHHDHDYHDHDSNKKHHKKRSFFDDLF